MEGVRVDWGEVAMACLREYLECARGARTHCCPTVEISFVICAVRAARVDWAAAWPVPKCCQRGVGHGTATRTRSNLDGTTLGQRTSRTREIPGSVMAAEVAEAGEAGAGWPCSWARAPFDCAPSPSDPPGPRNYPPRRCCPSLQDDGSQVYARPPRNRRPSSLPASAPVQVCDAGTN